ncbi:3813_t:CDS:1 [Scutellospora calospora]|uniref:3813_t:CDS:1 n=1 Tax=Scutellospora calospora TaxID=85575 RepID=A0ACA9LJY1_9GLOM|nr:3813_t:CDS:1 [Scutellospora calospora]
MSSSSNTLPIDNNEQNSSNEISNNEKKEFLMKCCIYFEETNFIYPLPCSHIYHATCLEAHLKNKDNSNNISKDEEILKRCPLCNNVLTKKETDSIIKHIDKMKKLKLKRSIDESEMYNKKFQQEIRLLDKKKELKITKNKRKFKELKEKLLNEYKNNLKKLDDDENISFEKIDQDTENEKTR